MWIKGQISRQSALAYTLEAHALGQKLGYHKYLMDMREARNTEQVVDNYEFIYHDMHQTPGLDRTARVAILISPGDHSHDFIVNMAQNTGLDTRLFTEEAQALAYLAAKP